MKFHQFATYTVFLLSSSYVYSNPEDLSKPKDHADFPDPTQPASSQPLPTTAPLELSLESYNELGKTGVWWINFYSPYCPRCKDFAPAWNSIYRHMDGVHKGLKFATVNCVTEGDLCDELGVSLYPAVNLYNRGELVDSFKGVKDEEFLKSYIDEHIESLSAIEEEDNNNNDNNDENISNNTNDKEEEKPVDNVDINTKENTKNYIHNHNHKPRVFPSYTGPGEPVNTKYPDSINSEVQPHSLSTPLNHKEFTRRVTATRDSWFIQFYSPSAKHATSIQPPWDQMAFEAQGKLNIGQVNCDIEKQLCKEAGIVYYPTLKYFASSLQTEYKDLRGTGDLLLFLRRAIEARNPRVVKYAEYEEIRQQADEVTFLYLYDANTAVEDFQAFEKLCVDSVGAMNVAKSNDTEILASLAETNLPALYAVSKDKMTRFPETTSSGLRDHKKLREWAIKHRQPLVPRLTPANIHDVFSNSIVVLAILDPREEEATAQALKELRAVAVELEETRIKEDREELIELRNKKQLKIDEAKDKEDEGAEERAQGIRVEVNQREMISVAWIDAIFWERWIKGRYGAYEGGSHVVINNERNGCFWDRDLNGDVLVPSRWRIIETVEAALSPGSKLKASTLPAGVASYLRGPQGQFLLTKDLMFLGVAFVLFMVIYRRKKGKLVGGVLGKMD